MVWRKRRSGGRRRKRRRNRKGTEEERRGEEGGGERQTGRENMNVLERMNDTLSTEPNLFWDWDQGSFPQAQGPLLWC